MNNARRRAITKYPKGKPAKASNYIKFLNDVINEKDGMLRVVLFTRVSACAQNYRGNLCGQLKWLKDEIKCYKNVFVIAEIKDVGSGWRQERDGLKQAAKIALKKGAIVLAETADRFIRSPYFNSQSNPSVQPTDAEYEDLIQSLYGVTLATMIHPDTSWKNVRGHQSKRGQQTKKNKGGRPKINKAGYKKKRRLEKLPRVLRLRQEGASWGKINKLTGISKTTAADWVRKHH